MTIKIITKSIFFDFNTFEVNTPAVKIFNFEGFGDFRENLKSELQMLLF